MKYSNWYLGLLLVIVAHNMYCLSPVKTFGGSSGTEISGCAIDDQGLPVGSADIRLRKYSFLSNYGDSVQEYQYKVDVKADDNGFFQIDSVFPDSYYIEINYRDSIAVFYSLKISDVDSKVILPEIVMSKMCSVSGSIEIDDDSSVYGAVRVFGLERYQKADKRGHFSIQVPYGIHTLRVSALDSTKQSFSNKYDMYDISVTVTRGETQKNIGTFRLNSIPLSPCADYSCDSLTIVSILQETGLSSLKWTDVSKVKDNRVTELNLRGLGITVLPKSVKRLQALEILDVGQNDLTSNNSELNRLFNLKVLKMDHNQLTRIQGDEAIFASLRYIDFSSNMLSLLPESMSSLTPDSLLDLSNNNLCELDTSTAKWADVFDPGWRLTQTCP